MMEKLNRWPCRSCVEADSLCQDTGTLLARGRQMRDKWISETVLVASNLSLSLSLFLWKKQFQCFVNDCTCVCRFSVNSNQCYPFWRSRSRNVATKKGTLHQGDGPVAGVGSLVLKQSKSISGFGFLLFAFTNSNRRNFYQQRSDKGQIFAYSVTKQRLFNNENHQIGKGFTYLHICLTRQSRLRNTKVYSW